MVAAVERSGDFVPDFGFGYGETAIAGSSDAPAPVDLFPEEKESVVHDPHLAHNGTADEKGTAASVLGLVRLGGPFVKTSDLSGVDFAAAVPDGAWLMVGVDEGAEHAGFWVLFGSHEKGVEDIGVDNGVVVEKQDEIGAPFQGVVDAAVIATGKAPVFSIFENGDFGKLGADLLN